MMVIDIKHINFNNMPLPEQVEAFLEVHSLVSDIINAGFDYIYLHEDDLPIILDAMNTWVCKNEYMQAAIDDTKALIEKVIADYLSVRDEIEQNFKDWFDDEFDDRKPWFNDWYNRVTG